MTKAQEQVLASLQAQGFVGRTFSAQEAFPGATPQDNANRRVLDSLARDGILAQGAPHGRALGHMAAGGAERQASPRIDTAAGREARQALEGWFQAQGINPKAMYDVPKARQIADEALQATISWSACGWPLGKRCTCAWRHSPQDKPN